MSEQRRRTVEALCAAAGGFSGEEIQELRRMLAIYKKLLPSHELGYWHITRQPAETVIEHENPPGFLSMSDPFPGERIHVRGHGQCVRCQRRFDIPNIGNFTTWEDRIGETVASAKEWVRREAEQAGPCWGDPPHVGCQSEEFAVMDTTVGPDHE